MQDLISEVDGRSGEGDLGAELAETRARLSEAQGELARLVRLAEQDFKRLRPGETSSVVAAAVRRPASKEIAARIARFVELFRDAAAQTEDRAPVVSEQAMREWLETSGLFDRQFYLSCNDDVAGAGTDPFHHYYHHGAAEARLPSSL